MGREAAFALEEGQPDVQPGSWRRPSAGAGGPIRGMGGELERARWHQVAPGVKRPEGSLRCLDSAEIPGGCSASPSTVSWVLPGHLAGAAAAHMPALMPSSWWISMPRTRADLAWLASASLPSSVCSGVGC